MFLTFNGKVWYYSVVFDLRKYKGRLNGMRRRTRRKFDENFKAQVAIASLKRDQTIAKIAKEHKLHPQLVINWRRELVQNSPEVFKLKDKEKKYNEMIGSLYKEIGRLQVESKEKENAGV